MPSPKELQEKRFGFLHALYELTEADRNKTMRLEAIAEKSKISPTDAVSIGQYLFDEKLIGHPLFPMGRTRTIAKYTGMADPSNLDAYRLIWNPKGQISITHKGIKEMEQALNQPDKPTEHFQPVIVNNFIQNSGMINNLQQGTLNSNQSAILNAMQLEGLQEIINQIRHLITEKQVTVEQARMLELETKTLELHAKSASPMPERIKQSLSSVKSILDTISAGAPIVAKIVAWLSGIN